MKSSNKNLNRIIYALKHRYGQSLSLLNRFDSTVDTRTGEQRTFYSRVLISKAVVLPKSAARAFVYNSLDPQFKDGGFFDEVDKVIILDQTMIPKSFNVDGDTVVALESKKYLVVSTVKIEESFVLAAIKHVEKYVLDIIPVEVSLSDSFTVEEAVNVQS